MTDTDELPPTQYLILEVLAARYRTGETTWTFPTRLRWALLALAEAGLIGVKSGVAPRTFIAWLTEAGRTAATSDTYVPPSERGEPALRIAPECSTRQMQVHATCDGCDCRCHTTEEPA